MSSTIPWLSILIETIHNHFPETLDVNPKNVVEWLLKKAKEKEITESKSTANAIFSIVKPQNYNPQKRGHTTNTLN